MDTVSPIIFMFNAILSVYFLFYMNRTQKTIQKLNCENKVLQNTLEIVTKNTNALVDEVNDFVSNCYKNNNQ